MEVKELDLSTTELQELLHTKLQEDDSTLKN